MPLAQRVAPLAPDGLALARRRAPPRKCVEGRVAGVLPVELLVGALQEAVLAEELPFGLGQEGDVDRGGLVPPAELDQAGGEAGAHLRRRAGPGRTSRRRPVAGVNGTETCSFG